MCSAKIPLSAIGQKNANKVIIPTIAGPDVAICASDTACATRQSQYRGHKHARSVLSRSEPCGLVGEWVVYRTTGIYESKKRLLICGVFSSCTTSGCTIRG